MSGKKTSPGTAFVPVLIMVLALLLISLLAACASPATTQAPATSAPAVTTQAPTSVTPATAAAGPAKPQGELVAALPNFGNENFLPWKADNGASQICDLVYDLLTYWDEVNKKFIPGMAESWDTSPDALTLTYHLRKGVQFSDGWGEFTSADAQYNFERQGGPDSMGQTTAARNIKSMETPDPYTLIIHFKNPAPTFLGMFSYSYGGTCQGFVSKKYIETVGEDIAGQKPIGTGPYKLVESKIASYYKLEALDSHWRVVPEFKTLTLRAVAELSTTVAMLKTKEIDLAMVTAEQMADLKAAGLDTEIHGGGINLITQWGGIAIPEDSRYDPAYHNKDPWTDVRVRKAMAISIDRQAICNAIYAGGATPVGVPLFAAGSGKYQYPFDQAAAKQLLTEAGYPDGFSFRLISSTNPGLPETPRVVEALGAFWQQLGLNPKITVMDYNAYGAQRREFKTAGDVAVFKFTSAADNLDRSSLNIIPGCPVPLFMDEESYAFWKEGSGKVNPDERAAYVDKLNQYFYDNYGPIPVVNIGTTWAWSSAKISPFPHPVSSTPYYLEYVRHAPPLNTFRLFTPWPGR